MKKLTVLALVAGMTLPLGAKVWTTVYRYDEKTPLAPVDANHPNVYRDIMVGTRLVLFVSSDTDGYWLGHLRVPWDDAPYGALSGRGYLATQPGSTAFYPNYKNSCLLAAGSSARVRSYQGPRGLGLEVSSSYRAVAGDWFVVDYRAEQIGSCDVGLYDLHASLEEPLERLHFTHIPSRDFNRDDIVDFRDFAVLASRWRAPAGPAADLNVDGQVGVADLAQFSAYWLERADFSNPAADPNRPSANP